MISSVVGKGIALLTAGRVALPGELMARVNLRCGDLVTISSQGDRLVLEKLTHLKVIRGGQVHEGRTRPQREAPALRPAAGSG
ncbi:MAG: AbrB/MazE/SpoVT family DNA-binding domain-containing protein [Acetobacteraceae bacterium]|nr:AbrB/MazE/SpoVT family DNA-binding domain-containing protein [Acetobacteraceae bacterium]